MRRDAILAQIFAVSKIIAILAVDIQTIKNKHKKQKYN